jgi:5-methylcytosine-specific restriction endonuclease McrA
MIAFIINHLTSQGKDYVIFKGHPIDSRNRKFKIWRKLLNEDQLRCHSCKTKVAEIRLVKCKGAGSIYKPNGQIKHTFKLYNNKGIEMTIDHLIPKSFLRRNGLSWNMLDNLVLMCQPCNKFKGDSIPYNWREMYNRMKTTIILDKGSHYVKGGVHGISSFQPMG